MAVAKATAELGIIVGASIFARLVGRCDLELFLLYIDPSISLPGSRISSQWVRRMRQVCFSPRTSEACVPGRQTFPPLGGPFRNIGRIDGLRVQEPRHPGTICVSRRRQPHSSWHLAPLPAPPPWKAGTLRA